MKNWTKTLIRPEQSIRAALQTINDSALQIALVVDDKMKLLGTVTDGDVRRGILRGLSLEHPVKDVMNPNPVVAHSEVSHEDIVTLMRSKKLRHIPIVDKHGRIVDLFMLDEVMYPSLKENFVVIMAGGLGTRLRPLTENVPKPMLDVGGKPLLETIIQSVSQYGFKNFYLAVNYKKEMIMDYFGDGKRFGVNICYLEEEQPLGTAGALSLLPQKPTQPFIVMNGDLLTKIHFAQLLDFHREHQAIGTMCVRSYEYQVPYGVVRFNNYRFEMIEEKPVYRYFVNAGIYVLDPKALEWIPGQTFFDMPDLFQILSKTHHHVAVFPIREYWLDIGRIDDYVRARKEYGGLYA